MKKKQLGKMMLLGMAGGWVALGQGTASELVTETPSLDAKMMEQYMIARPKCGGEGGCGHLTASRDVESEDDEVPAIDEDDDTKKKNPDNGSGKSIQSKKGTLQKAPVKKDPNKLA